MPGLAKYYRTYNSYCTISNAGTFESHIVEYREEMAEFSTSLRQNVKNVGKKIKEFFVESGLCHRTCLTVSCLSLSLSSSNSRETFWAKMACTNSIQNMKNLAFKCMLSKYILLFCHETKFHADR